MEKLTINHFLNGLVIDHSRLEYLKNYKFMEKGLQDIPPRYICFYSQVMYNNCIIQERHELVYTQNDELFDGWVIIGYYENYPICVHEDSSLYNFLNHGELCSVDV